LILSRNNDVIKSKDTSGRSPLHYAIFNTFSRPVELIRILIEHGADVNDIDIEGRTPLHHACLAGKSRVLGILVKNGASLGVKDFRLGLSPIEICNNE
jgi:ankyrin repeat protein